MPGSNQPSSSIKRIKLLDNNPWTINKVLTSRGQLNLTAIPDNKLYAQLFFGFTDGITDRRWDFMQMPGSYCKTAKMSDCLDNLQSFGLNH